MQGSKGIFRLLDAHEPEAQPLSTHQRPGRSLFTTGWRARARVGLRERRHTSPYPRLARVFGTHTLIENLTPSLQSLSWPVTVAPHFLWKRPDPPESHECLSCERSRHHTSDFGILVHLGRLLPAPCNPPEAIVFAQRGTAGPQDRDSYPCLFSGSLD